jgi:hypothetical protein
MFLAWADYRTSCTESNSGISCSRTKDLRNEHSAGLMIHSRVRPSPVLQMAHFRTFWITPVKSASIPGNRVRQCGSTMPRRLRERRNRNQALGRSSLGITRQPGASALPHLPGNPAARTLRPIPPSHVSRIPQRPIAPTTLNSRNSCIRNRRAGRA